MLTHTFNLRRRKKIISKKIPLVFGISGVARSGKDTFASYLINKFQKKGFPSLRLSFADAVKKDMDGFLKENLNISAFTVKNKEKEIIRPLLVCYATDVCRNKIHKNFWIDKIKPRVLSCVNEKVVSVIPDVRYENEAKWIKSLGGYIIHIERSGNKPANFEEKSNDPIVKKISDFKIKWNDFKDRERACSFYCSKLFRENEWSLYGEFK